MSRDTLFTVLNNTMKGLLSIGDVSMSNRVKSVKCSINKEGKSTKIVRRVEPSGIKHPKVQSLPGMVTEVKGVLGHPHYHRASAIVLDFI